MECTPTTIVLTLLLLVAIVLFALRNRRRMLFYRHRLIAALHQIAETNNFMSLFSENLTSLQDIENSMNMTAGYVADIIGAQSVCIFKREGDKLVVAGVTGAFPLTTATQQYKYAKPRYIKDSIKREVITVGDGIIGRIASSKQSVFIKDASKDLSIPHNGPVPIDSLMAIPLIHEGQITGVICAVNNRRKSKTFTEYQFSRFAFMASQVVVAQNFIQVYSNLSEQQRINQELEFAKQLQLSLLPRRFPAWDSYHIHSFSRSAKEVSGDFFDFVEISDNRLLIVVGDACGKGVPACMIMAMTRSFIRSNAERFTTLKDMLHELNNNLYRDVENERFITLACCLIDKQESTVEYARAGHTPMFMFIREHIREMYPQGTALGMLPSELAEFDTVSFEFIPGSSILLFTDGMNELINSAGQEYGVDRLKQVFEESSQKRHQPKTILSDLLADIDEYVDIPNAPQHDDQTMVLITNSL